MGLSGGGGKEDRKESRKESVYIGAHVNTTSTADVPATRWAVSAGRSSRFWMGCSVFWGEGIVFFLFSFCFFFGLGVLFLALSDKSPM